MSRVLDLHSLRLFVTVAEHLHFGRAARALRMAQPPLSQQIRRLEQRIGGRLFERTQRVVRLSPLGEALLADARELLTRSDALERRASALVRGEQGFLRIAYVSTALELVAPALGELRRAHSGVSLELARMNTIEQLDALRQGALHVGVVRLFAHDVGDLVVRRVWRERYVLVASVDDPLAARSRVELADLAGRPFLSFQRATQPALYDSIVAACARAGAPLEITQELETKREIVALAAAGLGVGLVPESSSVDAPANVVFVPVRGDLPPVELWAATGANASIWAVRFVEALARAAERERPARQRATQRKPARPRKRAG